MYRRFYVLTTYICSVYVCAFLPALNAHNLIYLYFHSTFSCKCMHFGCLVNYFSCVLFYLAFSFYTNLAVYSVKLVLRVFSNMWCIYVTFLNAQQLCC
uniref:Uncharacterized protein n=1 Tax=Rhipicephalus microplus TaxID=6941 RepID=A0A6M2D9W8_RHIMP